MTETRNRRLPVGIQSFEEIREGGYLYVDKTDLVWQLANRGKKYNYLSRPRRFGKSLLVDTLKELFEGNQALFTGLAAESRWDWSTRHPVIRISFAGSVSDPARLEERIHELIDENERRLGVQCSYRSVTGRFTELIRLAHERHGAPAVVLIDEYDKPILDRIAEPAQAERMREGLKARRMQLQNQMQTLHVVSPLATLGRGYSILLDEKGNAVRRAAQTQNGQRLTARLGEGELQVRVEDNHLTPVTLSLLD